MHIIFFQRTEGRTAFWFSILIPGYILQFSSSTGH